MVCAKLSKDIWRHIRSFSSDTGYEQTPTALLMHDLRFYNDTCGTYFNMFEFGEDGYSSTIVTIRDGFFRKPMSKCLNELCATCNIRDWSCIDAQPNRWRPRQLLRILHRDSDGYPIRALK